MLSRTADNLYWLARYMERAETAARLLEVGARISMLPNSEQGYRCLLYTSPSPRD